MTDQAVINEVALATKIRTVLTSLTKSSKAASVLAEAEARMSELTDSARAARDRALDPRAAPETVATARREAMDAAFERERIEAAVTDLKARVGELQRAEQRAFYDEEHESARQERDALAADLATRYPAITEELVGLLRRLKASDARIAKVNGNLAGRLQLESAEALARGCLGNWYWRAGGLEPVTRLVVMKTPRFDGPGLLWPEAQ